MRFFGPRFSIPIIGLFVLALGLYELNDPTNYRYSGNLLILAYMPIIIALAIFAVSVFYGTFRVSLRPDAIEKFGWPFRSQRFLLKDFMAIEERGQNVVLTFNDGRELKLSSLLSGRAYFVERLMALTTGSNGGIPQVSRVAEPRR